MNLSRWKTLIREDLYRYEGAIGGRGFLQTWLREPGFRITFLMRTCSFTRSFAWTRFGVYHLSRWAYSRISIRYGVFIDFSTDIGGGLYIPHPCSIIVNRRCQIGRDCNLSQNNSIGISNRGERAGCPRIGDRVYIGPGAVVFGRIDIGNDAAIGANAVVTKDIPDHEVYAGIPAKRISTRGSQGYINHATSLCDSA